MSSLRRCRIEGCTVEHNRSLYCCRTHWYALPKHYRDAIWRAYRSEDSWLGLEYAQAAENAEAFLEDRDAEDVAA